MKINLEHQKKIAKLKKLVISHPEFKEAYRTIENAYDMRNNVHVAQNIICMGESGTGKSTLKEKIRIKYARHETIDKTIIPVLIVDTPSVPTVKNLAEEMLIQLGDPQYNKGSAIEKTTRILNYINICEVKMIICDELQHFIDQGKRRTPYEVSDWLKTIIDKAKVSTILMGLERSENILRVNEQLRRRFSKRITLRPFDVEDRESLKSFIGVVKVLDENISLSRRIDLSNKKFIHSLYYATNGIIDYLVKLYIGAYEHAVMFDKNTLDNDCFEKSFTVNIWMEGVGKLNPFNKKFINEKLVKRGMPFNKSDYITDLS